MLLNHGASNKMNRNPNLVFLNRSFDKKRLKALLLWFRLNLSEGAALKAVESLQGLGFRSATQGAISLGLDDLKTPSSKGGRVFQAKLEVALAHHEHHRGNRTPVELFQHLVDTWHRTSQDLTAEVIQLFHSTEKVNPVYMMAFSGARGNLSQVRQLVAMRGLMADPRGQIVGFPILSNFREGLTITEYFVSCYGARKGVVDTAIRTADAGYLTRRLADVSHHVVVRSTNCGTLRGIHLRDIKEGQKTILPLASRLVGRVLAEQIPPLAHRNEEITPDLAEKIASQRSQVSVRSPLCCSLRLGVCQLCYGWGLSEGRRVTLGEAVGIIAAQSIGEPGTQLTLRTFHTGGVFSGDLLNEIKAPYGGRIHFPEPLQGLLVRTPHGQIAFLTKVPGKMVLYPEMPEMNHSDAPRGDQVTSDVSVSEKLSDEPEVDNNYSVTFDEQQQEFKEFFLQPSTVIFVREEELISPNQLLAQFSSSSLQSTNDQIQVTQQVLSETGGQVWFKEVHSGNRQGPTSGSLGTHFSSHKLGSVWVLAGKPTSLFKSIENHRLVLDQKLMIGDEMIQKKMRRVTDLHHDEYITEIDESSDNDVVESNDLLDGTKKPVQGIAAPEERPAANNLIINSSHKGSKNSIWSLGSPPFSTKKRHKNFISNRFFVENGLSKNNDYSNINEIDVLDDEMILHQILCISSSSLHLSSKMIRCTKDAISKKNQVAHRHSMTSDEQMMTFDSSPGVTDVHQISIQSGETFHQCIEYHYALGYSRLMDLSKVDDTYRRIELQRTSHGSCSRDDIDASPVDSFTVKEFPGIPQKTFDHDALRRKIDESSESSIPLMTSMGKKGDMNFIDDQDAWSESTNGDASKGCKEDAQPQKMQRREYELQQRESIKASSFLSKKVPGARVVRVKGRAVDEVRLLLQRPVDINQSKIRSRGAWWLPKERKTYQQGMLLDEPLFSTEEKGQGQFFWLSTLLPNYINGLSATPSAQNQETVKKGVLSTDSKNLIPSFDAFKENKETDESRVSKRCTANDEQYPIASFATKRTSHNISTVRKVLEVNERKCSSNAGIVIDAEFFTILAPSSKSGSKLKINKLLTINPFWQGLSLMTVPDPAKNEIVEQKMQRAILSERTKTNAILSINCSPLYSFEEIPDCPMIFDEEMISDLSFDSLTHHFQRKYESKNASPLKSISKVIGTIQKKEVYIDAESHESVDRVQIDSKRRQVESNDGSIDQHIVQVVDLPVAPFSYVVQPFDSLNQCESMDEIVFLHESPLICSLLKQKTPFKRPNDRSFNVEKNHIPSVQCCAATSPTPVQGNLLPAIRQSLWQESSSHVDNSTSLVSRFSNLHNAKANSLDLFNRDVSKGTPLLSNKESKRQTADGCFTIRTITNSHSRYTCVDPKISPGSRCTINFIDAIHPRDVKQRRCKEESIKETNSDYVSKKINAESSNNLIINEIDVKTLHLDDEMMIFERICCNSPRVTTKIDQQSTPALALSTEGSYNCKPLKDLQKFSPKWRTFHKNIKQITPFDPWLRVDNNPQRIVKWKTKRDSNLVCTFALEIINQQDHVKSEMKRSKIKSFRAYSSALLDYYLSISVSLVNKIRGDDHQSSSSLSTSMPVASHHRSTNGFEEQSPHQIQLISPVVADGGKSRGQLLSKKVSKENTLKTDFESNGFASKMHLMQRVDEYPLESFNLSQRIANKGREVNYIPPLITNKVWTANNKFTPFSRPIYLGWFACHLHERDASMKLMQEYYSFPELFISKTEKTEKSSFTKKRFPVFKGTTPLLSDSDQCTFALGSFLRGTSSTMVTSSLHLSDASQGGQALEIDLCDESGPDDELLCISSSSMKDATSKKKEIVQQKMHGVTDDYPVTFKGSIKGSGVVSESSQVNHISEGYETTKPLPIFPGQLVASGENIAYNLATTESGQILYVDSKQVTIRKAQTVLIYSQAIIAVMAGEWIERGAPLMALSYQKLVTGDIVQGLPKIEQFFEAPLLKDGTFWGDSLQAKLNQFFQEHRKELPLAEAVRKGFSEIQRVLVEGVQRVYISQGVLIADKHLEVIVRQMTSKGRILYSGDTGFLRNELVSFDKIESVNQVTYGQKALYHPQVRGITDASLESESFLSAASFQETTRVLSRDAVIGKTDLMRGLKERVIVGELIQAGTGLANNTVYHLLPS